MNTLVLTDIHGDLPALARLATLDLKPDLLLVSGDLTHFGGVAEAAKIVAALRGICPELRAVAGNCDLPEVEGYLRSEGIDLHSRVETLGGVVFAGLGRGLASPFKTPNEVSDSDFAAALADIAQALPAGQPFVLLAHQPPLNTLNDALTNGMHVGSGSVRTFIEERRPQAVFCGHIHEAVGVDRSLGMEIVNPGSARDGHYAMATFEAGRQPQITLF